MNSKLSKVLNQLFESKVTIIFAILCIFGVVASGQSFGFILNQVAQRIGRNAFLVLALLIPVLSGLGLNFGMVIGAMAAQVAVFFVVYWGFKGVPAFLLCMLIATPLAMIFGYLIGSLFNKMKGQEMIGGLILGFFSDGLYQLFFLFLIGTIIQITSQKMLMSNGVGVKNTVDLKGSLYYALDNLGHANLLAILEICFFAALAVGAAYLIFCKVKKRKVRWPQFIAVVGGIVLLYALSYIPSFEKMLTKINLPVVPYLAIALLCLLNYALLSTRLGQNMRTVGQSMGVATSAGLKVDRIRIIAIIMSTVLAAWGQLLALQGYAAMATYGAHTQVGLYAIAALLVGGASVHKATNKQAILGVFLFHTLFVVSPLAGKKLFNDAQIGEYFRVFVCYGVIALSLAMHAWKTQIKPRLAGSPTVPPAEGIAPNTNGTAQKVK